MRNPYSHIGLVKNYCFMESKKNEKGPKLLQSSRSGDLKMVKFLVEKEEVNINFQYEHGSTPLHHAGRYCHTNIARYLVSKGAIIDIEAKPDYPITPLICAVWYGHVGRGSLVCVSS